MANAKIDNNSEFTPVAVDTNGVIKNLLVDPISGRLLIEVGDDSDTPILNNAKIDENYNDSELAVDDNGVVRPLLVNTDNELLVDLILE